MANLKNKLDSVKPPVAYVSIEDLKTTTAAHDFDVQSRKTIGDFVYKSTISRTYYSLKHSESTKFDEWCRQINDIDIDFRGEFNASVRNLEYVLHNFSFWKSLVRDFMDAIEDYKAHQRESSNFSQISEESAKRLLLLIPLLVNHKPKIYIDANNGCFNADMQTRDNGILSTQISDGGQIFYSYVAQNNKIFKITGTAKFKDFRDYIKFNKILQML
ncbi:hypothetical protein [Burkholderia cepacia]|uniref:hypothetical protein n=1 Tax=Burkholderia cepacia TaxID=292 RepID=UPI000ACB4D67|nr:hypothetical protein [Burkholderia cepacia]